MTEARHELDGDERRLFTKRLLTDLRALERMLEEGRIESEVKRIGAEQEVFLVDARWHPAPRAREVLARLGDARFTPELALFNLEFNLDPLFLAGDCLRRMEEQLLDLLARAGHAAETCGAVPVMTGILPSLDTSDLELENMTPAPRYRALDEAIRRLRGDRYHFRIKGCDELILTHDNVMIEACNASFQVHFQVSPAEFACRYNVAQAVAAPVLAAAVNSPLLFGRRLWRETRIALFQQSIDTRAPLAHLRERSPRVSFGRKWVDASVLEIFEEDVARFKILLAAPGDEDPFAELAAGRVPRLDALRLHNSTVYRWNRPCYGVSDGTAHLRIENRVLPSGPTPRDEMANAAFWFGLIKGVEAELGDVRAAMRFDDAKENFVAAARLGLGAQLLWPGRRRPVPARELILDQLLPLARAGLAALEIDSDDADRYLAVVEERVASQQTGAQWMIDSLAAMDDQGTPSERLAALTAASQRRQTENLPVHAWPPARLADAGGWHHHYLEVGQIMETDLFTVHHDEVVDLAAHLMSWRHVRHVPVEDDDHRLIGLVSHRSLLRLFGEAMAGGAARTIPVSEIMQSEVVTATPEMPTLEAVELMKRHGIGCLPVVAADGRLVGMVTERSFMGIAGELLAEFLAGRKEESS